MELISTIGGYITELERRRGNRGEERATAIERFCVGGKRAEQKSAASRKIQGDSDGLMVRVELDLRRSLG